MVYFPLIIKNVYLSIQPVNGYGLGYLRINDDLSQEVNPSTAPTQDGVLLRVHPLRRYEHRSQVRSLARSSG
jgi:hypothetical protein